MNIPFAGAIHARILRVAPVSIHGDLYFDLLVEPDDAPPAPDGKLLAISVRVPLHAAPNAQPPEPGRRVAIQFLMQQVTALTYAP